MKNSEIKNAAKALLTPVALMGLGLAMAIDPDAATEFIGNLLGWGLVAVGVYLVYRIVKYPENRLYKILAALLVWAVAGRMLNHPLEIAAGLSRLAGILLVIKGFQERNGRRQNAAWAQIGIGAALILLPLTASRMVMMAGGALAFVVGAVMAGDRLRTKKLLNSWEDSEYESVESDYADKL